MTTTLNRLAELVTDERFRKLGARELRCINVMLAHTDHDGDAWPSTRRIAELAGVDYKDAQKVLRSLRERGFLRELQAPTGRRSRRVRVIPGATDQSLAKLRAPAREGGDAPPAKPVEGGASPGGKTPPSESVEGGVLAVEGGVSTPLEGGGSPPRTPKEPLEPPGQAAQRGIPRRHWPADDSFGGEAAGRIEDAFGKPDSSGLILLHLESFRDAGGSLEDLDGLIEAAGRGKRPNGLLCTWLRQPGQWRVVLADRAERRKHAASVREARSATRAAERAADLGRPGAVGPTPLGAFGPVFGARRSANG